MELRINSTFNRDEGTQIKRNMETERWRDEAALRKREKATER